MGNAITPIRISAAIRRRDALEFRLRGLSYREIFQAMVAKYGRDALPDSYDERNCYADVKEEMSVISLKHNESAKMMRGMVAERLDQLFMVAMTEALGGNLKAIDRVLKIEDFRARLFGLYEPSQVKVNDWRTEILDLIKEGKMTREQVEAEIGQELSSELFESRGDGIVEGSFTEEKSQ